MDQKPGLALFGFVRDRKLIGTAAIERREHGWAQVRRSPFTPEDRFLIAELTGDLVFELNRAA